MMTNLSNLPRLLLVSDLSLSKSSQSGFANPTLYNLFKDYPPELILQYFPESTEISAPTTFPHQNFVAYKDTFISGLRNRLGLVLNQWLQLVNLSILQTVNLSNEWKLKLLDYFSSNE
jgi:hypothetical protein